MSQSLLAAVQSIKFYQYNYNIVKVDEATLPRIINSIVPTIDLYVITSKKFASLDEIGNTPQEISKWISANAHLITVKRATWSSTNIHNVSSFP